MGSTPLIFPFKTNAGTFYGFSSAVKHINTVLNSSQYRIRFSKYALLKIPDGAYQSTQDRKNKFYPELFLGRKEASSAVITNLETNKINEIPASFQNFVLNFENLLLQQPGYDEDRNIPSVAERVFFKWLIESGAIRFRIADEMTEAAMINPSLNQESRRYTEEDSQETPTRSYERVVKHIGEINVVNTLDNDGQAFSEIYVHVPSAHGNTPVVLFKSVKDANYTAGMEITSGTFIEGQTSEFIPETPLPLTAFYNKDDNGNKEYQTSIHIDYNAWSTNQDDLNESIPAIQTGFIYDVLKSKLDGISIDFNPSSYIEGINRSYTSISEYNEANEASNFKFNSILIYYDVLENIGTETEEWVPISTNLYGIQFLLPAYVNGTGDAAKIILPSLWKFKTTDGSLPSNKTNGNSYGFRLNINLSLETTQIAEASIVNDYNTFSVQLFAEAMNNLHKVSDYYTSALLKIAKLEERLSAIEDVIYTSGQNSNQSLAQRIKLLEEKTSLSSPIFEQLTPSNTWVINHYLGLYPAITVVDNDNNVIYASIKYVSNNKIIISFAQPETGKVFLNVATS